MGDEQEFDPQEFRSVDEERGHGEAMVPRAALEKACAMMATCWDCPWWHSDGEIPCIEGRWSEELDDMDCDMSDEQIGKCWAQHLAAKAIPTTLDALRQGIPHFACNPGCHDCCGPVPTTAEERRRMGPPPEEGIAGLCVYATEEGCACYEERPLMCRLFGAVENLRCPHGCAPAVLWTRGSAGLVLEAYAREADVELTAVRPADA